MKRVVEEVLYGVIEQLLDKGYIDLEKYFVDGTKIEANANRYSFVWRKSSEKNIKIQETPVNHKEFSNILHKSFTFA